MHVGIRHFLQVVGQYLGDTCKRILVAGCGAQAQEAIWLASNTPYQVFGIDVAVPPDFQSSLPNCSVQNASVLDLPFEPSFFDAVFYHHVIEHVPEPERSLAEIARVMRLGGGVYVGTPNRRRIVGYIGSPGATFRQMVLWNWNDYKMRLRGRFRNEFGAHAGFTERELHHMLRQHFDFVCSLTKEYIMFKYGRRLPVPVLQVVTWAGIREYSAPAVYFWAMKTEGGEKR